MTPCVYTLASRPKGALYTGVTSDPVRRIRELKNGFAAGFTKRYGIDALVWYEVHKSMESAITREKAIKKWKREWKVELIENLNPKWTDLYGKILEG